MYTYLCAGEILQVKFDPIPVVPLTSLACLFESGDFDSQDPPLRQNSSMINDLNYTSLNLVRKYFKNLIQHKFLYFLFNKNLFL